MEHYAAIDVSLEWSSVCVVDAAGQIVREAKVLRECQALVAFFAESGLTFSRIGLEAGPAPWLGEAPHLPRECHPRIRLLSYRRSYGFRPVLPSAGEGKARSGMQHTCNAGSGAIYIVREFG